MFSGGFEEVKNFLTKALDGFAWLRIILPIT